MDQAEETTCPFCEGPIWTDDEVCLNCDAPLVPGTCRHCRTVNPDGVQRCGQCGSPSLIRPRDETAAAGHRQEASRPAIWLVAGLLCAAFAAGGYLAMRGRKAPRPETKGALPAADKEVRRHVPDRTPPQSRTPAAPAGDTVACMVHRYPRRAHIPLSAPDVGKNYARRRFPGSGGAVCTRAVFRELLKAYVKAGNTDPAIREVVHYEQGGEKVWSYWKEFNHSPVPVNSPAFPSDTCTGVCIILDIYMEPYKPLITAPDVGRGYARRRFPGACSAEKLRGLCTPSVYEELSKAYHRTGNGGFTVRYELAWYDEDGALVSRRMTTE